MSLYLKEYQKYNRSKSKCLNSVNKSRTFKFDLSYFWLPFINHTVLLWKALRYGKVNSRGLSCGRALNIHLYIWKSGNLLHKRGSVDSQFGTTVYCIGISLIAKLFVFQVQKFFTISKCENSSYDNKKCSWKASPKILWQIYNQFQDYARYRIFVIIRRPYIYF